MRSPFSGMDPYIEGLGNWSDFHDDLIGEIKRLLQAVLPAGYFVQTGERSYVVLAGVDEKERKSFRPDVGVASPSASARLGGTAVAERSASGAVTMHAFVDEHFRENFIEICSERDQTLITGIEVLSPSNKRPGTEGWTQYLRKRNAFMLGAAHFVELDLLRSGERMPMVEPWPDSPYYLLVSRRADAPSCRVWPAGFKGPLPELVVPLAEPDLDLSLPLQTMIQGIYLRCRYGARIDYAQPPNPPFRREETTWLEGLSLPAGAVAKPVRPSRRGRGRGARPE